MFFGHCNMFIYKNFKPCSDQVLNFLVFFKPHVFICFRIDCFTFEWLEWNVLNYILKLKMMYKIPGTFQKFLKNFMNAKTLTK